MTNQPQKPDDAVEVMADARKHRAFIKSMLAIYKSTHKQAEFARDYQAMLAVFAADPLRLALGEVAIQAILNGEAAVVPLEWGKSYKLQSLKYTNGATSEHINLRMVHLGQPAKGDDHG